MGSATATVTPAPLGLGRVLLLVAGSIALHALVLTAVRDGLDSATAQIEPPQRTIDATLIIEAPPPPPTPVVRRVAPRPRPRPAPPKPAPVQEPVVVNDPAPVAPPSDDRDRLGPGEGDTSVTPDVIVAPPTPVPDVALVQPAPEQAGVAKAPDLASELSELGGAMESLPVAGTYVYKLRDSRYSALSGTTTVDWKVDTATKRYETRLRSTVFGIQLADITSTGFIRRFGLAPDRFVQKTGTRAPQAANLDWEQRIVTFSSRSFQRPAHEGMQDRVSFLFQLMALGQNLPDALRPGATLAMEVAGPGDVDSYQFIVVGLETVETAAGPMEAIKIDRPRTEPNFQRIEVWLAPDRKYLPVAVRFTDRRDNVTEMYFESANEGG
jgi:hypothetical protein